MNFFSKKILVTGSSGFVGSWLTRSLILKNNNVSGIGLKPLSKESIHENLNLKEQYDFAELNINDYDALQKRVNAINPDIVFHLASQPLVIDSYLDPINTFNTNVSGTSNLLHCLSNLNKEINIIVVTSDKCYRNENKGIPFLESDPLGGFDPYSASKACQELTSEAYANSYTNLNIKTARAGNIIGGGDWSKDRIVTDLVEGCINNSTIVLRNPNATRPWQHVLDAIAGYAILAKFNENKESFDSFNFGPGVDSHKTVLELSRDFLNIWGKDNLLKIDEDKNNYYEAKLLSLDVQKSHEVLNFRNKFNFGKAVSLTSEWYKIYYEGDGSSIFDSQITNYFQ